MSKEKEYKMALQNEYFTHKIELEFELKNFKSNNATTELG